MKHIIIALSKIEMGLNGKRSVQVERDELIAKKKREINGKEEVISSIELYKKY